MLMVSDNSVLNEDAKIVIILLPLINDFPSVKNIAEPVFAHENVS